MHSDAGQSLIRAAEIRALTKTGITITLSDLTVDDARALMIIEDESAKYDAEQARMKPNGQ